MSRTSNVHVKLAGWSKKVSLFIVPLLTILSLVKLGFTAAVGDIRITEIMYDPSGTDTNREWVEIYNASTSTIDLSGWIFYEADTNHSLTFVQGGSSLPAGGYAIIADSATTFLNDYASNPSSVTWKVIDSSFGLSNSGESIAIKDTGSVVTSSLTYVSTWNNSVEGKSIERINTLMPEDQQSSWLESITSGGTPGALTPDSTRPAQVINLAVVANTTTAGAVDLTWTAPGDDGTYGTANRYSLYVSTVEAITSTNNTVMLMISNMNTKIPQAPGLAENFTLTGLTLPTTYWFAIFTFDEVSNSSMLPSNSPSAIPGFAPIPPNMFYGIALSRSSIEWYWNDLANNETGYKVYDVAFDTTVSPNLSPNTTVWLETGLTPNKYAKRDARVFNAYGTADSIDAYSYTFANAPIGTFISAVSSNSITVDWEENNNPTGTFYRVDVSTNGIDFTPGMWVTTRPYIWSGLQTNVMFYFRVIAQNFNNIVTTFDVVVSTKTKPAFTGSISGTISYGGTSTGTVIVYGGRGVPGSGWQPQAMANYPSVGTYKLDFLPDATDYYVFAGIDKNNNGQLEGNIDPVGVTGPVIVTGGGEKPGVAIQLADPSAPQGGGDAILLTGQKGFDFSVPGPADWNAGADVRYIKPQVLQPAKLEVVKTIKDEGVKSLGEVTTFDHSNVTANTISDPQVGHTYTILTIEGRPAAIEIKEATATNIRFFFKYNYLAPSGGPTTTGSITGQVTRSGTGTGIQGVEVEALRKLRDPITGTYFYQRQGNAFTVESGTYTIGNLPTGPYVVKAMPGPSTGLGIKESMEVFVSTEIAAVVNIELGSAGGISGTITDVNYTGIANVNVMALEIVTKLDGTYEYIPRGTAMTNSTGDYTISGLSGGKSYRVVAIPSDTSGFARGFVDWIYVMEGTTADYGDLTLYAGGSISGQVKGAAGPLPAVEVIVYERNYNGGYDRRDSIITNTDGMYRIPGLAVGTYKVEAKPPINLPLSGQVKEGIFVDAGKNTVLDFMLAAGSGIKGTVKDYTGLLQQSSAKVTLKDAKTDMVVAETTTDSSGTYSFAGLAPVEYKLECYSVTDTSLVRKQTRVQLISGQVKTVDFVLDLGATLSGKLTNFSTALPLMYPSTGYLVLAMSTVTWTKENMFSGQIGEPQALGNELIGSANFTLPGVPAGTHDLYLVSLVMEIVGGVPVGSPKSITSVGMLSSVAVSSGDTKTDQNFTLTTGSATLNANIRSEDGRPLFSPTGGSPMFVLTDSSNKFVSFAQFERVSDYDLSSARVSVYNLPGGTYNVIAFAEGLNPQTTTLTLLAGEYLYKEYILPKSTALGSLAGNVFFTAATTTTVPGTMYVELFDGGLPPAGWRVNYTSATLVGGTTYSYTLSHYIGDYFISAYLDKNNNGMLDPGEPVGNKPEPVFINQGTVSSGNNVFVREAIAGQNGTVSGLVDYKGTAKGRINIQSWLGAPFTGIPSSSIQAPGPGPYLLQLPAGVPHSISAFLDTNGDGRLNIDINNKAVEPFGVFNSPVTVETGKTVPNVNLVIFDPGLSGSSNIAGEITYTGQKSGKVGIAVFKDDFPPRGITVTYVGMDSTGTFRVPNLAADDYYLFAFMDVDNDGKPSKTDPYGQVGPIWAAEGRDTSVSLELEEPPVFDAFVTNVTTSTSVITPDNDGTNDQVSINFTYATKVASETPHYQGGLVRLVVDLNQDNIFDPFDFTRIIWDNYGLPGGESKPHYNRRDPSNSTWDWYNSLPIDQKKAAELTWEEFNTLQYGRDLSREVWIDPYMGLTYKTNTKTFERDVTNMLFWEGRNAVWQVVPNGTYRFKLQLDVPFWDLSDGITYEYTSSTYTASTKYGINVTTFTVNVRSTGLAGNVYSAVKGRDSSGNEILMTTPIPMIGAKVRAYSVPDAIGQMPVPRYGEGVTGVDGKFSVWGLAPGTYNVDIDALGYPVVTVNNVMVANANIVNNMPAPVYLTAGGTLTGLIRTIDNQPVSDAYINIYEKSMYGTYEWRRSAFSVNMGSYTMYEIKDLFPGTYRLEIIPPADKPLVKFEREGIILESAKTVKFDVILGLGSNISGTVSDYLGLSINAGRIEVQTKLGPTEFKTITSVETSSTGVYSVTGLLPGIYRLIANPPYGADYIKQSATFNLPISSGYVQNFTLKLGGRISGSITNFSTLPQLAYGTTGYLLITFPSSLPFTLDNMADLNPSGFGIVGLYGIPGPDYSIYGLPTDSNQDVYMLAGEWELPEAQGELKRAAVVGKTFNIASSSVSVTTGVNITATVGTGSLSGMVKSGVGQSIFTPESDPFVVLFDTNNKVAGFSDVHPVSSIDQTSGWFEIKNLPSGEVVMGIIAHNHLPIWPNITPLKVVIGTAATYQDFTLQQTTATGTIAGTVSFNTNGQVNMDLFAGGLPPEGRFVKHVSFTNTGAYSIPDITPGVNYALIAYLDVNSDHIYNPGEARGEVRNINVQANLTTAINISLTAPAVGFGTVKGRVSYTGTSLGRIYVQAWPGAVGQGNPVESLILPVQGDYAFFKIPADLSHSISAFKDTNGNGQLDKDNTGKILEPFGSYNTPVVVSVNKILTGINITILEPGVVGESNISGISYYSGLKAGKVYINLFNIQPNDPAIKPITFVVTETTGTFRIPNIAAGMYYLVAFMDTDNTNSLTKSDPVVKIGPIDVQMNENKTLYLMLEEPPAIDVFLRNIQASPTTITPNNDGTNDYTTITMQYNTSVSSLTPNLQTAQVRVLVDTNNDGNFVLLDLYRIIWDNYGVYGKENTPHVRRKSNGTLDLANTSWEWYNSLPIDQKKASEISWDELHILENSSDWFRDEWVESYTLSYSTSAKTYRGDVSVMWEGRNTLGQAVPDGIYRYKIQVDAPYWDPTDGVSFEYAPTGATITVRTTSLSGRVFTAVKKREPDGSEIVLSSAPMSGVKVRIWSQEIHYMDTGGFSEGITNASGTFIIGGLVAGTSYSIDIDALGYPIVHLSDVLVQNADTINNLSAPVFLSAGGKIEGVVRNLSNQQGVGNVYINVYEKMMDGTYEWRRSGFSIPNGTYAIPDLQTGVYRIEAIPPADLPLMRIVRDGIIIEPGKIFKIDLMLGVGGSIVGTVSNYLSLPVVSGQVIVERRVQDKYEFVSSVYTIEEGSYSISGLETPARYRLICVPPEGVDYIKQVTELDLSIGQIVTRNFTLSLGGTIKGKLTNATLPTLHPETTGYAVITFSTNVPFSIDTLKFVKPTGYGVVDSSGEYIVRGLPLEGQDVYVVAGIGDLNTGWFDSLKVVGARFNVPSSDVQVSTGADVTISVGAVTLNGKVISGVGQPLFSPEEDPFMILLDPNTNKLAGWSRIWQTSSYELAAGEYWIGNLAPATRKVIIGARNHMPGTGEVVIGTTDLIRDFVLLQTTATGTIAGSINYKDTGQTNIDLFIGGLPPEGKFIQHLSLTTTGTFTIGNILPGLNYAVMAYLDVNTDHMYQPGEPRGESRNITVRSNQTSTINLNLVAPVAGQYGKIKGSVIYTGKATGRIYVRAWPGAPFTGTPVSTAAIPTSGEFTLDKIPSDLPHSISAFIDVNNNGVAEREVEPFGVFGKAIVNRGTETVSGVDIVIIDRLPGIVVSSGAINGTVQYSGLKSGNVSVSVFVNDLPPKGMLINILTMESTGTFRLSDLAPGNYFLFTYMDSNGSGEYSPANPSGKIGPIRLGPGEEKAISVNLEEPPVINAKVTNITVLPLVISPDGDNTDDEAVFTGNYVTNISSAFANLQSASVRLIIDIDNDGNFEPFDWGKVIWDNYDGQIPEMRPHFNRTDPSNSTWDWYNSLTVDLKKEAVIPPEELERLQSGYDWTREDWIDAKEVIYSTSTRSWGKPNLKTAWDGRDANGRIVPNGTYRAKVELDAPYWDTSDGINFEYMPSTFAVTVKSAGLSGQVSWRVVGTDNSVIGSGPVAYAKVFAGNPTSFGFGVTDSSGTFTISGLSLGTYHLGVEAEGYASYEKPDVKVSSAGAITVMSDVIYLRRGASISGNVILPAGFKPFYDAEGNIVRRGHGVVEAWNPSGPGHGFASIEMVEGSTTVPYIITLPPGTFSIQAKIANYLSEVESVLIASTEPVTGRNLTLNEPGRIEGSVTLPVTAAGDVNVHVGAQEQVKNESEEYVPGNGAAFAGTTILTGNTSAFYTLLVNTGTYKVSVITPGYVVKEELVTITTLGQVATKNITLSAGSKLVGKVLFNDTSKLKLAEQDVLDTFDLTIRTYAPKTQYYAETKVTVAKSTEPQTYPYTIPGLVPGTYIVDTDLPGFETIPDWVKVNLSTESADVPEIKFVSYTGTITGKVEGYTELEKIRVLVRARDWADWQVRKSTIDATGNFTITGLGTGEFIVTVNEFDIYESSMAPTGKFGFVTTVISLANGETKNVSAITLSSGGVVRGKINWKSTRRDINELKNKYVIAVPMRMEWLGLGGGTFYPGKIVVETSTSAVYRIDGLAEDSYIIIPPLDLDEDEQPDLTGKKLIVAVSTAVSPVTANITLTDGHRIKGSIQRSVTGTEKFEVQLVRREDVVGQRTIEFVNTGVINNTTKLSLPFELGPILPGKYQIRVWSVQANYADVSKDIVIPDVGDDMSLDITLSPIVLVKRAAIKGKVVDAKTGKPVTAEQGIRIIAEARPWVEGGWSETNANDEYRKINDTTGEFKFAHLPAGKYVVRVELLPDFKPTSGETVYAGAAVSGITVPDSTQDVDIGAIKLEAGLTVTGKVTAAVIDGTATVNKPLANIRIIARPSAGTLEGIELTAVTDTNGRYVLAGLKSEIVSQGAMGTEAKPVYWDILAADRPQWWESTVVEYRPQIKRNIDPTQAVDVDFQLTEAKGLVKGKINKPSTVTLYLPFAEEEEDVPGAFIVIQDERETFEDPLEGIQAIALPDGNFMVRGLEVGINYTIKILAKGLKPKILEHKVIDPVTKLLILTDAEITLERGALARGFIRDAEQKRISANELRAVMAVKVKVNPDNSEEPVGVPAFGLLYSNSATKEVDSYEVTGLDLTANNEKYYLILVVKGSGELGDDVFYGPTITVDAAGVTLSQDITYADYPPKFVVTSAKFPLLNSTMFFIQANASEPLTEGQASEVIKVKSTPSGNGKLQNFFMSEDKQEISAIYKVGKVSGVEESSFTITIAGHDVKGNVGTEDFTFIVKDQLDAFKQLPVNTVRGGGVKIGDGDSSGVFLPGGTMASTETVKCTCTKQTPPTLSGAPGFGTIRLAQTTYPGSLVSSLYDIKTTLVSGPLASIAAGKSAKVTVQYDKSKVTDPTAVKIYRYDEPSKQWVEVTDGMTVDSTNNTVTANTSKFSTFAAFSVAPAPQQAVGYSGTFKTYSYPNPAKSPSVTSPINIKVAVPGASTAKVAIKVYTVVGELVWDSGDKQVNCAGPGVDTANSIVVWDGNNKNGSPVASGVYIYTVTVDGKLEKSKDRIGKLAVIR